MSEAQEQSNAVEVRIKEKAPPNSLPTWEECDYWLREGKATALHNFIFHYDDADPHHSAWFLHHLELVIAEAKQET